MKTDPKPDRQALDDNPTGSGFPTLLLRGLSLATLLIIDYSDGWILQDGGSRQARAHQGAALLL